MNRKVKVSSCTAGQVTLRNKPQKKSRRQRSRQVERNPEPAQASQGSEEEEDQQSIQQLVHPVQPVQDVDEAEEVAAPQHQEDVTRSEEAVENLFEEEGQNVEQREVRQVRLDEEDRHAPGHEEVRQVPDDEEIRQVPEAAPSQASEDEEGHSAEADLGEDRHPIVEPRGYDFEVKEQFLVSIATFR